MKSAKKALIISDNIPLTEELKRLLDNLEVKLVTSVHSDKEALDKFFTLKPDFTFLDLDSETIRTQALAKALKNSEATKLSLICTKNHKLEWIYGDTENIVFIKKPITLTKLNDIVNPHLSFSNLLDEAKALLRQETGSQEWQV